MADLFSLLDGLWTKAPCPEERPPMFMLHRFLASNIVFAPAARELQVRVRDSALQYRIWQGLLPKGRKAPRLGYAAPKKSPAAELAVTRLMQVTGERRTVCEEYWAMLRALGRSRASLLFLGIDPDVREKANGKDEA